jgi:hypothetical protein
MTKLSLRTALILEELYASGLPRDVVWQVEDQRITVVVTPLWREMRDLLLERGFSGPSHASRWDMYLYTSNYVPPKETDDD